MIVKKYSSRIVSIQNPVSELFTLEFEPICGIYKYTPGQFLHLAIDDYDGNGQWPDSRCFSIQTAPTSPTIKITYSIKGAFTNRMANELHVGSLVTLKLPYGSLFEVEDTMKTVVFIAGGTGITPFLSLFSHVSFTGYKEPILFLGLKNVDQNHYHNELQSAVLNNPSFSVHLVYETVEGILNIESIFKEKGKDAVYYISGPPMMIQTFRRYLALQEVPVMNIRTDDWE